MPPILAVLFAALFIGLSKGGLGGAAGGLVVPLLSSVMPVSQAVGISLPLLILGDVFALQAYWRRWEWPYLRLLLPAAVGGALVGVLLLTTLPDIALRRLLGAFTLLAVLYKLGSDRLAGLAYTPRPWHGWLAGGGAGLASAMANAGGPILTIYLLLQKRPALGFLGTTTLFFAVINLFKLPFFLGTRVIDLPALVEVLWALPAIPVGVWLGKWVFTHVEQRVFEGIMLALLAYAGVTLLLYRGG
ncbi:MAG: sulfite exporter TauE/SafE family protein [Anaerolineae bacterium]|nr:sulfite exporter TauE/SafE family protein [Anaerolineae bacterium]